MSRLLTLLALFVLLSAKTGYCNIVTDTTNAYYGSNYEKARYPYGDSALKAYIKINTTYPEDAKEAGVQGRIVVQFFVNEKGKISNVEVIRGIGGDCDEIAKCIVDDMPDWIPAMYKKKPVSSLQQLVFGFKLE